jgi:tRNA-specific 2-thiouridylase
MTTPAYALPRELRDHCADPHIVVAMSGGVDSSVAALLLKRAGYRVSGIFMKNWNEPDDDGQCRWEADVADVLAVCEPLDIPVNTVDLSKAYWDEVFDSFVAEYAAGRTPNPDVLCNREIKFKAFLDHARAMGGDFIATGHYARNRFRAGRAELHKGTDAGKDQTYFMYAMGQSALRGSLFPVGELDKRDVRRLAESAGLPTHAKKDSTGICFIGEQRFRQFMRNYLPARPGDIRTTDGIVIGRHEGAAYYTLGQREGLGIGGVRGAAEGPWFVVGKDVERNELIAAQGHDHPLLMSVTLVARSLSWLGDEAPRAPLRCTAKTRYRQADQICTVTACDDDAVSVEFEQPQRAVTPGQSVVFYAGSRCLGGGVIEKTGRERAGNSPCPDPSR